MEDSQAPHRGQARTAVGRWIVVNELEEEQNGNSILFVR